MAGHAMWYLGEYLGIYFIREKATGTVRQILKPRIATGMWQ